MGWDKLLKASGTSSQYIKADGSLDSSPSSSGLSQPTSYYKFDGIGNKIVTTGGTAITNDSDFSVHVVCRTPTVGTPIVANKTYSWHNSAGFSLNTTFTQIGSGSAYQNFDYPDIPTGVWTDIIITADYANNVFKVYLNGVAWYSATLTLGYANTTDNLTFGAWANLSQGVGNPEISSCEIYNKVLSTSDIAEIIAGIPIPYKYKGASTEILADGGFETWSGGSTTDLTHWAEYNTGSSTTNQDSDDEESGTYCVRLDVDASDSNVHIYTAVACFEAGKRYRVKFSAKCSSGTCTASVYESTTSTVPSAGLGEDLALTTSYQQFSFEFTALGNSGANQNLLFGRKAGGGAASKSLYFDSASVVQIGAVAEYDGSGATSGTWYDKSGNNLDGTVTGATLQNKITALDVTDNATFGGMVGAGISPAYPIHGYAATGTVAVRAQIGSDTIDLYPHGTWNHIMGSAATFYFNKEIRVETGKIGSYNEDLELSTSGTTRLTLDNSTGDATFASSVQLSDGQQVQWGGGNNAIFGHDASDYVSIKTNGTDRLKIDDTGFAFYNMPIKLSATEKLYLDGGSNTYIEEDSADTIIIATGGTTALTLTSSQNATFAGTVTAPALRATSQLIAADNMFMGTGQFYLGAEGSSTDDTWRMYGYSAGKFILESRESGTWTERFNIGTSGNATFGGEINSDHHKITTTATEKGLSIQNTNLASALRSLELYIDSNGKGCIRKTSASGLDNDLYIQPDHGNVLFKGSGKVGIGTASPAQKLHVVGSDTSVLAKVHNSGTGATNHVFLAESDGSNASCDVLTAQSAGHVPIFTAKADGNVGIGTASPDRLTEISATLGAHTPLLRLTDVGTSAYFPQIEWFTGYGGGTSVATMGATASDTNGGEWHLDVRNHTADALTRVLTIDKAGNVGIGTATPGHPLEVSGGHIKIDDNKNLTWGSTYTAVSGNGANTTGWISLNTSDLSRIKILGDGKVGIGATAPPFQKLTVTGASQAADSIFNNGILAITTGTGVLADTKMIMGIVDDDYAWMQAGDYGVAYRDIVLNPLGGNVGIGTTGATIPLVVNGMAGVISQLHLGPNAGLAGGGSLYIDPASSNFVVKQYSSTASAWVSTLSLDKDSSTATFAGEIAGNGTTLYPWQSQYKVLQVADGMSIASDTGLKGIWWNTYDTGSKKYAEGTGKYGANTYFSPADGSLYHRATTATGDAGGAANLGTVFTLTKDGDGIFAGDVTVAGDNIATGTAGTAFSAEKSFTFTFEGSEGGQLGLCPSHQKVQIYLPASAAFWGACEVSVTSSYWYANAPGLVTKSFGIGLYNGNVYTNDYRYSEVLGLTADHFAIGNWTYDGTNSRYYLPIVHRTTSQNACTVVVRWLGSSTGDTTTMKNMSHGSVYTTDTTVYAKPAVTFGASTTGGGTITSGAITSGGITATGNSAVVGDMRITGDITEGSTTGAMFISGDAGIKTDPTYSFFGDENTGMYRNGADNLAFATNSIMRLDINSAGKATFGGEMAVAGDATFAGTGLFTGLLNPNAGVQIITAGGSFLKLSDSNNTVALRSIQNSASDSDMGFYTQGDAERMRMTSTGNIGIGTTTPNDYYCKKLVVSGPDNEGITILTESTTGFGGIMFADGTGVNAYRGQFGYDHNDDSMGIWTAAVNALSIDSSQNATFAGTIGSGAITSSGTVSGVAGTFSGALTAGSGGAYPHHTIYGTCNFYPDADSGLEINNQGGNATGVVAKTGDGLYLGANGAAGAIGINTSQEVNFNQDATFAGDIIMASGKGIDFSAGTEASGNDSTLLHDYEEGTWTPTGQTLWNLGVVANDCRYVKVGSLVTLWGHLNDPVAASSDFRITGLPFTVLHPAVGGNVMFKEIEHNTKSNNITPYVNTSEYMYFYVTKSTYAWEKVHGDDFSGSDDDVYFSIQYETVD